MSNQKAANSSKTKTIMAAAIGIDLGTSYSCVGVWKQGTVKIIANDKSNRVTPSYVAFTNTECLIGDAAKNQIAMNPANTVFDTKRLIGRRIDDPKIYSDIKHWPFKVVNEGGKPNIEVEFRSKKARFSPEEISSMVLTKMKETAEAFLGQEVKDAVIAVPAYFNNHQRLATKKAAVSAGLNVLRTINEPMAAALAYGFNRNLNGEKNVLIFDLGSGKLDVSILTIDKGLYFEIKATAGDTHLGGKDFDSRLVSYLRKEFERKYTKKLKLNPAVLRHLNTAAEKAKCTLSISPMASIEIDGLLENINFRSTVSRDLFEELCADLFKLIQKCVEKAFVDAKLDKNSIDDVVLVGGSSHMPKIQSMLQDYGKHLNHFINSEEAVAYGAAVYAAVLTDESNKSLTLQKIRLIDVAPLSLGIEIAGAQAQPRMGSIQQYPLQLDVTHHSIETETQNGLMIKIIERNHILPCRQTQTFTTPFDNQTTVTIQVYEGESAFTKDNNLIGRFELSGIAPAPRGHPKIEITFVLDVDGILSVTAKDTASGVSNKLVQSDKLNSQICSNPLFSVRASKKDGLSS